MCYPRLRTVSGIVSRGLRGNTRTPGYAYKIRYLCVAYGSTDFLAVEADRRQRRCEFVELQPIEDGRFAGRIQAEHDNVNRICLQLGPVDTHRIGTYTHLNAAERSDDVKSRARNCSLSTSSTTECRLHQWTDHILMILRISAPSSTRASR